MRPRFDIAKIDAYVSKGGDTRKSTKNKVKEDLFKNSEEFEKVDEDPVFGLLWKAYEEASFTAVRDEENMPEENEDDNIEYKLTLADLNLKQLLSKEAQM